MNGINSIWRLTDAAASAPRVMGRLAQGPRMDDHQSIDRPLIGGEIGLLTERISTIPCTVVAPAKTGNHANSGPDGLRRGSLDVLRAARTVRRCRAVDGAEHVGAGPAFGPSAPG